MIAARFAAAACAALILSACNPTASAPTISGSEVDALLTKAVILAAERFPASHGYCIAVDLAPSTAQPSNDPIVDGWRKGPSPEVLYRDLAVPPRRKLPEDVLSRLPSGLRASHCDHPIVFEEPYAVQLRVKQEIYMQVYLPFSDRCPVCGAGYEIAYRQTDHGWQIEPPGLTRTWIS